MQSDNRAKMLALKAVMNNPKLSRILQEGLSSAEGSTKREQAKAVISILKKAGSSNVPDYLGGQKNETVKAKNIYAKILEHSSKPVTRPASGADGQGGAWDGQGGVVGDPYAPKMDKGMPVSINTKPGAGAGLGARIGFGLGRAMEGLATAGENAGKAIVSVPVIGAAIPEYLGKNLATVLAGSDKVPYTPFGSTASMQSVVKMFPGAKTVPSNASSAAAASGVSNIENNTTPSKTVADSMAMSDAIKKDLATLPLEGIKMYGDGTYLYKNRDGSGFYGKQGEKYRDIQKNPNAPSMDITDPNIQFRDQKYSDVANMAPGDWKKYDDDTYIYINKDGSIHYGKQDEGYVDNTTAVASDEGAADTGSDGLAGISAEDRKILESSYSGGSYALSQLKADGIDLSSQYDQLRKVLAEELGLNKMTEQLNQVTNSGLTLGADMINYIKQKDTFVKSVDTMIDGVKNNMTTSGGAGADPQTQRNNASSIEYLTLLKGRQNSRYIDIINETMKSHDAKMTNITNLYNTTVKQYESALATKTGFLQDDYNRAYQALSDIWTTFKDAPKLALEMRQMEASIKNTEAETLAKGITDNKGLFMKDAEDMSKWLNISTSTAQGADKNIPIGTDLTNAVSAALLNGNSASGILYGIQKAINGATDVTGVQTMIDKFIAAGGDEGMAKYGYDGVNNEVFSKQLSTFVQEKAKQLMSSQLSNKKTDIKSAVEKLTSRTYKPDKLSATKREDFIKSYEGTLTASIAGALYDYYANAVKDPDFYKNPKAAFPFLSATPGSDEDTAWNNLVNSISLNLK